MKVAIIFVVIYSSSIIEQKLARQIIEAALRRRIDLEPRKECQAEQASRVRQDVVVDPNSVDTTLNLGPSSDISNIQYLQYIITEHSDKPEYGYPRSQNSGPASSLRTRASS